MFSSNIIFLEPPLFSALIFLFLPFSAGLSSFLSTQILKGNVAVESPSWQEVVRGQLTNSVCNYHSPLQNRGGFMLLAKRCLWSPELLHWQCGSIFWSTEDSLWGPTPVSSASMYLDPQSSGMFLIRVPRATVGSLVLHSLMFDLALWGPRIWAPRLLVSYAVGK